MESVSQDGMIDCGCRAGFFHVLGLKPSPSSPCRGGQASLLLGHKCLIVFAGSTVDEWVYVEPERAEQGVSRLPGPAPCCC